MPLAESIDVERLLSDGVVAGVEAFATLGSTQDHAIARARSGPLVLPHLVVAEEQTAGRGRGQNSWWTGRGSLAFTLVFDAGVWALEPGPVPSRALVVGVAIVDALAPLVPEGRVGLHWPNDVYVGQRKVAGVLVDVLGDGLHVVGIGINVNNPLASAPDDVRGRAASLCELAGRMFDRTAVLLDVLHQVRDAMQRSAAAPLEFGRRFDALGLQTGHELTIESGGRRTAGRCEGIQPDGALVLATPSGRETLYSGVLVR